MTNDGSKKELKTSLIRKATNIKRKLEKVKPFNMHKQQIPFNPYLLID